MRDDDWEALNEIWAERLRHVQVADPVDAAVVEDAISRLYYALDRPEPDKHWVSGTDALESNQVGVPINHIMQHVLGALWLALLPDIELIAPMLGYDPATGDFRLGRNKPTMFRNYFQVKSERGRFSRRPPWTHHLHNLVTQFDAPAVALYQLAASRSRLDPRLDATAEACRDLLDAGFGGALFEHSCLLINRPIRLHLDGQQLLSSTSGPALDTGREQVYAVHGVGIPVLHFDSMSNNLIWANLAALQPRVRVATIEYLGWERFLGLTPRTMKDVMNTSRFGRLYTVRCGQQEMMLVEVTNASAEPDGTFRKYVIPVDPRLRPLPNPLDPNGKMGDPQIPTALNAVASTFGMTGEAYAAILGEES